MTAEQLIEHLGLEPHPSEGGYFLETYRSRVRLTADVLPDHTGARDLSTAIYYLLTPETFSAMHRVPGDEVFHFYLGDPVEQLQLHPDGSSEVVVLGAGVLSGQTLQAIVPGGSWQGARLVDGGRWALLGTTMAPGFDFADFEEGDREVLAAAYPEVAERIAQLTR